MKEKTGSVSERRERERERDYKKAIDFPARRFFASAILANGSRDSPHSLIPTSVSTLLSLLFYFPSNMTSTSTSFAPSGDCNISFPSLLLVPEHFPAFLISPRLSCSQIDL